MIVSDPDVADAIPLTDRSLSVLGKKIGTARVSVYGEAKKLVGVFDIEVSYDTSRLGSELAQRFPHARFRVSSVNGRIMLSGSAPNGMMVDQAMTVAKQFGADVINAVKVNAPQQVMLEVRFVEASRSAQPRARRQLAGRAKQDRSERRRCADDRHDRPRSGAIEPFGTFLGSMLGKGVNADVAGPRAGRARDRAPSRRTESGRALGRHRELPGGRRIPDPGCPRTSGASGSSSRNTASGLPSRPPCSATA